MPTARLDYHLRNTIRTYRVVLADVSPSTAGSTSGTQTAFEVIGSPGKRVKLRHFQLFKASGTIAPFRVAQYSAATTGSTGQSAISPTRISHSTGSTYLGNVRFYTVSPLASQGTLLNQGYLVEQDISTGDVVNEHFGDERGLSMPTLYSTGESFAGLITSTSAVVLNGYLEFSEEP